MKAIVYTSKNGHTAQYAEILGELTRLPVYSLKAALKDLENDTEIIYLGWVKINKIQGYKRAARKFKISAALGVGFCDTGTMTSEVRKATDLPRIVPLFTLQGGLERANLKGLSKLMVNMLTNGLSNQNKRTETDERLLYLLTHEVNNVTKENTGEFMQWFRNNQH